MHLLGHLITETMDNESSEEEIEHERLYNKFFDKRPYSNIVSYKIKEWASSGNPQACLELSHRYLNGSMSIKKDDAQSSFWARRAIELFSEQSKTQISSYFKKHLSYWFEEANGQDCSTYLNYQKRRELDAPETLENFSRNFGIGHGEEILFTRDTSFWDTRSSGLVITDKAIYAREIEGKSLKTTVMRWKSILNVTYNNNTFFFYEKNGNAIYATNSNSFFKDISIERLNHENLGEILSRHLTEMAQLDK